MTQITKPQDAQLSRLLLDQLADKWTIRILRAFCPGTAPVRFNEIKRRVSGISQKTLTLCLRSLERSGILKRCVISAAPLGVEYSITPLGMTLEAPINSLHLWAERHVASVVRAQEEFDERKNHVTRYEGSLHQTAKTVR